MPLAEKARLAAARRDGLAVSTDVPARDRHGRAAARVALRQLACTEPALPRLAEWRAALDRGRVAAEPVH